MPASGWCSSLALVSRCGFRPGPYGGCVDARLHALVAFLARPEAASLAAANKRIANILKKSEGSGASSIDAALFVMSYHDAYWRPEDGSWNKTDPAELLERLFAGLKPGGVVVVQDHVANAGGDVAKVVDTLHRIDPALVKQDFAKAGFVFDGESKVLAHPEDDHTRLVFDESIRGKSDQFIYRFRKPIP